MVFELDGGKKREIKRDGIVREAVARIYDTIGQKEGKEEQARSSKKKTKAAETEKDCRGAAGKIKNKVRLQKVSNSNSDPRGEDLRARLTLLREKKGQKQ